MQLARQSRDPEAAARLSPADVPRLQRALSVRRATGQTLGAWRNTTTAPLLAEGRWTGAFLAPQRERLYASGSIAASRR